jgi:hypothetical protein
MGVPVGNEGVVMRVFQSVKSRSEREALAELTLKGYKDSEYKSHEPSYLLLLF